MKRNKISQHPFHSYPSLHFYPGFYWKQQAETFFTLLCHASKKGSEEKIGPDLLLLFILQIETN